MNTSGMVWVLLAAAALFAPYLPAADLTAEQIAEKATPSVVLIRVPAGLGSGFVVSNDGRIVTNYHVIRGAKQATVVTADGREFKDMELMAADPGHDLAVLRTGAHGLRALALGDSAIAKPGEHVVAIGHPLGLGNTVSDGLLSAVRVISPQRTLLQISAPISPGSSGGPVFNDRGEVIGISTLLISGGQNLNFAVPINAVKPLLDIDKGVALAAYVWPAQRKRNIPNHPLALLEDCPAPQLRVIVGNIQRAIDVGAPLYNQGNVEACYRIYEATALDLDKQIQACPGPRRALLDGVSQADKLGSYDDKAWAMRDAFDGLLDLAARKAGGTDGVAATGLQRQIPYYPAAVLDDCDGEGIASIGSFIGAAINSGAPLYNKGNVEACYRIYQGAIGDIARKVKGCPAAKQALQDGLGNAERQANWQGKAWALRDSFDGMIEAIQRGQGK